jgi:tellurite resistance protein
MQKPSKSAEKLTEMIKKAIDDHQLSQTERTRIMMIADEDGVIDPQERRLLAQLQDLIEDGSVKVIPD